MVPTPKIVSETVIVPRATGVSASLACTVKVSGSAGCDVGVPEITPLVGSIVRPGGSAPSNPLSQAPLVSMRHHWYGAIPPVAEKGGGVPGGGYGTPTDP